MNAKDQRGYPRQVRMTDDDHARAVALAVADGKTFSEYMRDLVTADAAKKAKRK